MMMMMMMDVGVGCTIEDEFIEHRWWLMMRQSLKTRYVPFILLLGFCKQKDLISSGKFFPANVKTAFDRLSFIGLKFPAVEVDSSHYAIPPSERCKKVRERTNTFSSFSSSLKRHFFCRVL